MFAGVRWTKLLGGLTWNETETSYITILPKVKKKWSPLKSLTWRKQSNGSGKKLPAIKS